MILTDPHKISTLQTAQLYRHAGASFWMCMGNASILAAVLWSTVEPVMISVWLATVLAAGILRLRAASSNAVPGRYLLSDRHWTDSHLVLSAITGAAWGSVALLIFPQNITQQVLLVLITATTAAGGVAVFLALPAAYAVYLACMLVPLTVRMFLSNDPALQVMSGVLIIFGASLWGTARSMHAALMDSLSLHFNFQNLASLDGLTQISNRRTFDAALDSEWNRASRSRAPLSLIMIDIDHFKKYNDHYGHQSGDACLQQVAQTLARKLRRAGDFVARYGGEEFVLLLYQTPRDEARTLAVNLCAAVRELGIEHADSESGYVTISLGGATIVPNSETTAVALLAAADKALYGAKHAGRDRVEWNSKT